jgi:hypothetical protein
MYSVDDRKRIVVSVVITRRSVARVELSIQSREHVDGELTAIEVVQWCGEWNASSQSQAMRKPSLIQME